MLSDLQVHSFASSEWSSPVDAGPEVNTSNSEISAALSRTAYGEPFFTHETVRIDDVVGMGVRSL